MEVISTRRTSLFKRVAPRVLILLAIGVLVLLFISITSRLNDLREAPGDNVTWGLSQVEVEVLLLTDEVIALQSNADGGLNEVHRRFDALYSRVAQIKEGPAFAPMRSDAQFSEQLQDIQNTVINIARLMDGPEAELRGSLDTLLQDLTDVRDDAHDIALTGIRLRSDQSDAERLSFSRLLLVAAVVTAALVLLLGLMYWFLLRQYKLHRETSAAVRRANRRLQSSFNVSLDAIIVANNQGVILDINEAAEEVFGFTREEVVGCEMADLIIPEQYRDAHHAGMKRFNETKEPRLVGQGRIEITALRKSGEEFPVEISIGQATDHRGTIFISYLRDITARIEAEEELKKARDEALEAEKAKSNFLAVMSHEMRTPLNGLFGVIELLQQTRINRKQADYLDIAQRSGNILLHHVNDVLDVSRMDAGKLELAPNAFDLSAFFRDVITTNEATAYAKGNRLVLDLKDMPAKHVWLDEQRLRQIAFNLVSNALKFTDRGKVTLSARVSDEAASPTLAFSVTDTGVGISQENQSKVFERFFTQEKSYDRLASGTGLGLTICKQIVEMMDGEISLESEPGKGATFTVSMPLTLTEEDASIDAVAEPVDTASLHGKSLLLVEDNEINRVIIKEMLTGEGVEFVEAVNGREAVDAADAAKFDAILMDVSMPVMNGVDATEAIRGQDNLNAATPIIGLTAHALADEQARFLDAGMDVCLPKPISHDALTRALVAAFADGSTGEHLVATDQSADASQTSHVDLNKVAEMREFLTLDKIENLVTKFTKEVDELVRAIPNLLNDRDLPALAALTHKSNGSAGMMGMTQFHEALRALEQAAKAEDHALASDAAATAIDMWPDAKAALWAANARHIL